MIIIGIDPGTASTGWGIIKVLNIRNKSKYSLFSKEKKKSPPLAEKRNRLKCLDYGCIKTPVGMVMSRRLLLLQRELKKIIANYQPNCLVMEQLFFGVNSKTAMSVGQARGVVMVTTAQRKLPLYEYQGLQVKFTLTGYGRSDKKQMQEIVQKYLRLKEKPKPDDAADALAVAICHTIKNVKEKK